MSKLVWIDLELTGLDVVNDTILEIAVLITDLRCENLIAGPDLIINTDQSKLDLMSAFVTNMHTTSGLLAKIKASTITLAEAEEQICCFLSDNHIQNAILAGNSVHMDRMFLIKSMPRLFEGFISKQRIIDVSSVKELYRVLISKVVYNDKKIKHRSLDDILESVKELKFYIDAGVIRLFRL